MVIKVSVIIPVYNAERYIASCIDSLLKQTLKECEFIFINDGSKDASREIIEDFMSKEPRIQLYNQSNQGVSIARNKGLELARGEYVGFVDADDYVEKGMYERLYNAAEQNECDLVITNFESEMQGHKLVTKYPFPAEVKLKREFVEQELLPYFLKADNLNTVCNKLYQRKVIVENALSFPKGMALGEDGWFNINFISYTNTVFYMDYTGYHYREVVGSATRDIAGKDYFGRALEVYRMQLPDIFHSIMNRNKIEQLKSAKLIHSLMSYIHVYFTPSKKLSFRQRYKYIKNMIENRYVREALPIFYVERYKSLGKYERFIFEMIKRKSMFGLYLATAYSRFRNE